MTTPAETPIRYESRDPLALGPDEQVLWERPVPSGRPVDVRVTTERLIVRRRKVVRQRTLDELTYVEVRKSFGRGVWAVFDARLDLDAPETNDRRLRLDATPFSGGGSLLPDVLTRGFKRRRDQRTERRGRRANWRPIVARDTSLAMADLDARVLSELFAQPLDGEVALWTGRPEVTFAGTLARQLWGLFRASLWTIGSVAAVVGLWHVGLGTSGPLLIAGTVGGLILIGQFLVLIVGPWREASRLRATRFLLTNYRVIARTGPPRRATERSTFFDDSTDVTWQADRVVRGVGSVRTGGHGGQIEQVRDAETVYNLVLRAVAGHRGMTSAAASAVPVATVAPEADASELP